MMKKIINTPNAPAPLGPYNQAVLVGNTLFISGQLPFDVVTGKMIEETIEASTKQVMENLKAVLEEADMSFENVVKTSIFIADMNDFAKINAVYGTYFNEDTAPARETVQVARLPKDVRIEISMIATK